MNKIDENRVRRMAQRQGLMLLKSRRRDQNASDYGGYSLVDPETRLNVLSPGRRAFQATLAEVETYLIEGSEQAAETGTVRMKKGGADRLYRLVETGMTESGSRLYRLEEIEPQPGKGGNDA